MTGVAGKQRTWDFLLGGRMVTRDRTWDVRNPYSGEVVGRAAVGTREDVEAAIADACRVAKATAALPSHARATALDRLRQALADSRDEIANLLAREAGKTLALARAEVDRAVFVLQQGAEEAKRIGGEVLPMDLMPHGEGRWAITRRFPRSPIAAITPFNFPVLLAAHKLAPAMACGATMVLKPPPQDPLSTLALARLIPECGYPAGAIAVVPCENEDAAPLLDDPRIRMITFTGSARVGWMIRQRASTRPVALELGGNAAAIIEPDADLGHAVRRTVAGGYLYAGQSCISTQRILVHRTIYQAFVDQFVPAVAALKAGDPMAPGTDVGPMIDEASARRAEEWIQEAVRGGARLATGGGRRGSVLEPAVLLESTSAMRVNCEEIFAPATTVRPYDDFEDALAEVNASTYGLQAGVFTHDFRKIQRAFETLEVGAVVINEVPGFRVDHVPYGGVKQSGLGREGPRAAIEEMTELRVLMLG